MEDQAFTLLLTHLNEIKEQNKAQIDLIQKHMADELVILHNHIAEDNKVHRVVERHSVYFGMLGLGIPTLLSTMAKKLGLI